VAADKRPRPARTLRIIGGRWRSRRLGFPERDGLRPTPDRVRETLFNWLAAYLPGARCLDAFAGSGALGLEALSRGAAEVVFVESDPGAVAALRANLAVLEAQHAGLVEADVLDWLRGPARPFDIVFLDPPYRSGLLAPACALLAERGWVAPGGLVYLETPEGVAPPLPPGWTLTRSKTAGQVGYHLARVTASGQV
jgi:16S rRNA (guanine966-N2)-methyltransferase